MDNTEEKMCLFPSDYWMPCDENCRYYKTCTRRKDRDGEYKKN